MDLDAALSVLATIWSAVFGLAVAGGFFALVWMRSSARWRRLAQAYPAPPRSTPNAILRLETVILHEGRIAFNSFRGIVTAHLYETGVELSLLPPFSIGYPPIFIPYSDTIIEPYSWYLIGEAFEIKTLRASEITIVIHESLADAIKGHRPQIAATA